VHSLNCKAQTAGARPNPCTWDSLKGANSSFWADLCFQFSNSSLCLGPPAMQVCRQTKEITRQNRPYRWHWSLERAALLSGPLEAANCGRQMGTSCVGPRERQTGKQAAKHNGPINHNPTSVHGGIIITPHEPADLAEIVSLDRLSSYRASGVDSIGSAELGQDLGRLGSSFQGLGLAAGVQCCAKM